MIFALIGPRGGGKTTVGKRLANLTGWPYLATDDEVVETAGKTVTEIVESGGWPAFRELEKQALQTCLSRFASIVEPGKGGFLDTGGGIILDEENRAVLQRETQIIYLHASPRVMAKRVAESDDRPALTEGGDPIEEIKDVFAKRDPLYVALADLELDTETLGIEAIVTVLMNWVTARCGVCEF
ncbi:MAG: shikimate kinase [Candidatus Lernaella stagnicola]|nr:shikimate kinase [Candidatus Lernaella stagnicola]